MKAFLGMSAGVTLQGQLSDCWARTPTDWFQASKSELEEAVAGERDGKARSENRHPAVLRTRVNGLLSTVLEFARSQWVRVNGPEDPFCP